MNVFSVILDYIWAIVSVFILLKLILKDPENLNKLKTKKNGSLI